jgi:crotonobetainyl-CoA:carnitine CoA-transferase CaiB-like acyl-CoA transferase
MAVVKVEPPGGDPVRRLGPFAHDVPDLEGSLRFAYLNAGKQSLTLDLAHPEGRGLLLRLVEQVDVVLVSGTPGELDGLGLTAPALAARNPRLVVTAVSGFGQSGPHAEYQCPDIVGFAMGGLMHICGDLALPPLQAPETQAYYYASLYAALGTLLALWRRGADGPGEAVDVSIQEAIASQEHLVRAFGYDGESIHRHGSQHENVAPANIFPARDGFVYVFVSRPHWKRFLAVWPNHPPELDAPEWEANHVRRARSDWLNARVAEFTARFTRAEVVRLLQENGVPCLPVNSPADFVADEQVQARGLFQPTAHPHLGHYAQPAFPALLDGARNPAPPPPRLGEHTRALLRDRLGLSATEIELLFAQGII